MNNIELEELGNTLNILGCSKKEIPNKTLLLLSASLQFNQVLNLKNHSGNTVGYISWAEVDIHSILAFLNFQRLPEFVHEWKEGNIFWILDFNLPEYPFKSVIRSQIRCFFKDKFMFHAFGRKPRLSFSSSKVFFETDIFYKLEDLEKSKQDLGF